MQVSTDRYNTELFEKKLVKFRPFTVNELIFKRIFDILGGLVGALFFVIAVFILFIPYHLAKGKDKGPMMYRQKRYGRRGNIFYIWKFRTMIMDAEHYLDEHPEIKQAYHDNGNKLEDDPRVTKIGKFIRQHSIDELPQFVNVLKGEMSLVGPRPILLFEDKEYGDRLPYLLMCKPGITGYWTTHGRSAVVFPERADLELHYLEVHSLVFDAALIFMTIAQSIYGKDAY
ncbi:MULTISPECIES: sugar transferase [unclassified Lactococcus]|uniref:sugar transferase n=1 Tax=unclassified Lactococcus TaxID=2643510 RepID=UPI0011CA6877|nr:MULTISPECIES: sugar transferase [unclassified Lactococcus]MQW22581.1 sugar transferase [Lactococcus sp. dk101]TXK45604.1 sugar transferase [Lactococcus sp. dk310]TXK51454.1 sugar transferase [Lactococcus sp. dk322]